MNVVGNYRVLPVKTIENMKKETKKEIIDELYLYTELDTVINGSLQEVADNILALEKRLKAEHAMVVENPDKYIRFNIQIETEYEGYAEIKLYGVRMETDEEFKGRIERNKKAAEAQKASAKKRIRTNKKRDLATFLRLQKKYGTKKNV